VRTIAEAIRTIFGEEIDRQRMPNNNGGGNKGD
jgi:hypothetical protein